MYPGCNLHATELVIHFVFLYFAHKALSAQIKYRSFVLRESQAYFPLLCMLMLRWWRFIIERENHRNWAPVCYVPFFVFLSSILHVFFCQSAQRNSSLLGCVFVGVTVLWWRKLFCVAEREKEVVIGVWDAGVQSGTSTTSVSSNEKSHICLPKVFIFWATSKLKHSPCSSHTLLFFWTLCSSTFCVFVFYKLLTAQLFSPLMIIVHFSFRTKSAY